MSSQTKSVTNAQLALLTLLAEKPMHGYEIEQIIESRGMRDWTSIGFSSIYYLLEKMRKSGWLTRSRKTSEIGGPIRQIYTLTKAGHSIWLETITKALSQPNNIDSQFQIALSALPLLDKKTIISSLENHTNALKIIKINLESKAASYHPTPPWHVHAMFDLSISQIDAMASWIEKFLHENYA